ncbi:MAG: hypothetical protein RR728_04600 [Oscillospiraceae bacterium]
MKKTAKIIAIVVAFALVGGILFVTNAFVGNPISKLLATNAAHKYINEHYTDTDYIVEKVQYNFKDGGYYGKIKSPSSVDTYFSLAITSLGKVGWDSYEDMVTSGRNTWDRVDSEYRKLAQAVFEGEDFPYVSDIDFGTIREKYSAEQGNVYKDFGIATETLVLDEPYDVRELGAKYGEIIFYAQDETVSVQRASEILLDITKILDEKNVPFYAITFVLQKPRIEDMPNPDNSEIHLTDFLYSDIYKTDLTQRVQKSHEETTAYFAAEDAKKMESTGIDKPNVF